MLKKLMRTFLGDPNEREIAKLQPIVDQINALEPEWQKLTDQQLRAKTDEFRNYLAKFQDPDEREKHLDDILPEAFATVREAARRTVGMRHYDVQLIGGIVLHQGKIAEMKTGEGKTLVATLPLYLNALLGRGAHLVTPNDYLSKVGVQWMGPIYHFLGLSVAVIQSQTEDGVHQPAFIYDPDYMSTDDRYLRLRPIPRKEAYLADITYGTNNEFGFDYLRDNMVRRADQRVQRELFYAIIDEVDNILIDEARTPLIISGPADEPSEMYHRMAQIVRNFRGITQREYDELMERLKMGDEDAARELERYDYVVDEKMRTTAVLESGVAKAERALGVENLYAPENFELAHFLDNAIRAKALYERDRHYIVSESGEVIIVDEFTGRLMYGRRFSEGLHQAIEAKEGVEVRRENLTLATITYQNFFRMYKKLAGMTGTALTEAEEFYEIYKLDVVAIPTNKPVIRIDFPDQIYKTERAKADAVVREIVQMHVLGRPVLVGTASIERSEMYSRLLSAAEIRRLALRDLSPERLQRQLEYREEADFIKRYIPDDWDKVRLSNKTLTKPETLKLLAALWGLNPENETHLTELQRVLERGIPHEVLNAKYHEREAEIIAQAGRPKAVTIATNMAGRGVDILLGGNPEGLARSQLRREGLDLSAIPQSEWNHALDMLQKGEDPTTVYDEHWARVLKEKWEETERDRELVKNLGGLHIIGTERHEARRIDNQLRGRAGRQGDPGSSRFYLSLEDDLMRRFGGQNLINLMDRLGLDDDIPIENKMISRAVENAQTKVEGHNFDIRKRVLEYDDVVNKQREVIYQQRNEVLEAENLRPHIERMIREQIHDLVETYLESDDIDEEPDPRGLFEAVRLIVPLPPDLDYEAWANMTPEEVEEQLWNIARTLYDEREKQIEAEGYSMRELERQVILSVVDRLWIHHLTALDALRDGIGLRALAQQDPLVAYKNEAFHMFNQLVDEIEKQVASQIFSAQESIIEEARKRREMYTNATTSAATSTRRGGKARKKKRRLKKKAKA